MNLWNNSIRQWSYFLICSIILLVVLYYGRALWIPFFFGLLVAIVTYPFCKWLESKRFSRTASVTFAILLVTLFFVALIWLLTIELNILFTDIPLIKKRIIELYSELQNWLEYKIGLRKPAQRLITDRLMKNIDSTIGSIIGGAMSVTANTLVTLILVPIFGTLFLFHRETFVSFLENLLGDHQKNNLLEIIKESITTYYRFVKGTLFVYLIVGGLNAVGLLALGIDHAIVFGMITAFMTAIPYIGIIISASLPVSLALVTKDSLWYASGVVLVFTFVQYLEANIIFPKVVGRQLNLSTFSVLVAIIVGTILWGIAGMILFVPFAAILKIVSERIEGLKPLSILLNRTKELKI